MIPGTREATTAARLRQFPAVALIRAGEGAGQFLLLGSAAPDLLRQSGESLAGRIAYMELPPLDVRETGGDLTTRWWVRGGSPPSCLAEDDWRSDGPVPQPPSPRPFQLDQPPHEFWTHRTRCSRIVVLSDCRTDTRAMQVTRLRAKNQITLPASVVAAVGLKEGDIVHVEADQDRVVITAQEVRDRGRTYTMSDLLGAASGLYDSVDDIDAEIAAGRTE